MAFSLKRLIPPTFTFLIASTLWMQGCYDDDPVPTSWSLSERTAACAPGCDVSGRRYVQGGCAQHSVEACDQYMYPARYEANCSDGQSNVVRGVDPNYTEFVPCHVMNGTCVAKSSCGRSPGTCDPNWEGSQCPEPCADGRIRENRICVCEAGTVEDEASGECVAMSTGERPNQTGGTISGTPGGTSATTGGGATGGVTSGTAGGVTGGATGGTSGGATGGTAGGTLAATGGGATGGTTGGETGGATGGTSGGAIGGVTGGATGGPAGGTPAATGGGVTGGTAGGATGGEGGQAAMGGQGGSTISACGEAVLAYRRAPGEPPETTTDCFAGGQPVGDFNMDEAPPMVGACETCGFNSVLSANGAANDCVTCFDGFEIQKFFDDCTGFCVPVGTAMISVNPAICDAPVECVY